VVTKILQRPYPHVIYKKHLTKCKITICFLLLLGNTIKSHFEVLGLYNFIKVLGGLINGGGGSLYPGGGGVL